MVSHIFGRIFGHVLPCGMPFGDEKPHGMPFEATPLAPSHTVCKRKRKLCGTTSERKSADSWIFGEKGRCVARPQSTHGILAKKEVVWCDLSAIFHHSVKKEGGWCNLSVEKCRLVDFRRKRKVCGATSVNSWIFSEKGSHVA